LLVAVAVAGLGDNSVTLLTGNLVEVQVVEVLKLSQLL
jgi:hypothetical protein